MEKRKKKVPIERVKVSARVTPRDYEKLARIVKQYGLKSLYALMNYLVYCFLRAYDEERQQMWEELPEEIIRLFRLKEDRNMICREIARQQIRKRQQRKRRKARPACVGRDLFDNMQELDNEVRDIFDEAQEMGSEFPNDINRRGAW